MAMAAGTAIGIFIGDIALQDGILNRGVHTANRRKASSGVWKLLDTLALHTKSGVCT
jgi:hypothetical protein